MKEEHNLNVLGSLLGTWSVGLERNMLRSPIEVSCLLVITVSSWRMGESCPTAPLKLETHGVTG